MKKITLLLLMLVMFTLVGCNDNNQKNLYLPEAKNDKIYTSVGGEDETPNGEGYTLSVPTKNYRYEKDYDDGALEEK